MHRGLMAHKEYTEEGSDDGTHVARSLHYNNKGASEANLVQGLSSVNICWIDQVLRESSKAFSKTFMRSWGNREAKPKGFKLSAFLSDPLHNYTKYFPPCSILMKSFVLSLIMYCFPEVLVVQSIKVYFCPPLSIWRLKTNTPRFQIWNFPPLMP